MMVRNFKINFILLLGCCLITSCASTYNNMVVDDRLSVYYDNLKLFEKKEKEYLNTLYNLERYPDEKYLLEQKGIQSKNVDMQRQLVIQARTELDKAISDWEHNLTVNKKNDEDIKSLLEKAKDGRVKDRPEWKGFK